MRGASEPRGVVFVLPTSARGQLGPIGGWISTSGWAAAAERVLGRAWVATPAGILTPAEVRAIASKDTSSAAPRTPLRRSVPSIVKTVVKDVREWQRARRFHVSERGPWSDGGVEFVWQRHELFHTAGLELAEQLRVPSVLFVPALIVSQANQWGVRRPGWGRLLERRGEAPALRRADLIACGSDLVAEDVMRLVGDERRIMITPTGVDLALFQDASDRDAVRRSLDLSDRFVVGWCGSFRPFHALDQLVEAAVQLGDVTLLLVGDGPERPRVQSLAEARGVDARFTGGVPHDRVPTLLSAMDVGVALARADEPFHYSPLKLAEYLAAGLPTVAPSAPHLVRELGQESGVTFFQPGDATQLALRLRALRDDRARLSEAGARALAAAGEWSWDAQIARVRARIDEMPPVADQQNRTK